MKEREMVTCYNCRGEFPKKWLEKPDLTGVRQNGVYTYCSQKCRDVDEIQRMIPHGTQLWPITGP